MTDAPLDKSRWTQIFCGNIVALGLVSFLTDAATEMIYPLLPAFFSGLVTPAAVAVYIGLMEGMSETAASLLKLYFGRVSDRIDRRKPLVLVGYAVSSVIRPFTAVATFGWEILAFRLADRVGKGVRTAPRDALLSESVDAGVRGRAFSLHRLMDHAGAVAGPLAAVALLSLSLDHAMLWSRMETGAVSLQEMGALRVVFALAAIPGMAAVFVLWRWVSEGPRPVTAVNGNNRMLSASGTGPSSSFFLFLVAMVCFTLGNSSDLFLIFYAQSRIGAGLGQLLGLWVFLHLAKIVFSLPGGWLGDRLGMGTAIICGWVVYAGVYAVMPFATDLKTICLALFFYGLFYGLTEGAERALIAEFVPSGSRGRAYGLYHGAVGLAALPASLIFGVFWAGLGPKTAFFIGAGLALSAVVLLAVALRACPQTT